MDDVEIFNEESKFLAVPKFIHRHKINSTHDHLAMVFFVKSTTDKLKLIENKEITLGCKWFTKEELESDRYKLTKDVKYMALSAIDVFRVR